MSKELAVIKSQTRFVQVSESVGPTIALPAAVLRSTALTILGTVGIPARDVLVDALQRVMAHAANGENGGFTTMDGSYTMLLENGGRPGIFGMAGGIGLAPPMSGWATRTTLMTLEDLEMDPPTKWMGPDGRGTIDVTFYGRTYNQYYNYSFAVYMVSPTRMYWIETDSQMVFSELLQGTASGQLGGTYVYMGGGLTVASGSEGTALALLDATATSVNGGTFDGIVDVNLPTNLSPVVTRMIGSTAGSGTYSADSISIYVKWLATFVEGQNFTFYVNSSGQAVMVGQTGVSDNPVLDGWMSLQ
jgi:hypothetical protein